MEAPAMFNKSVNTACKLDIDENTIYKPEYDDF